MNKRTSRLRGWFSCVSKHVFLFASYTPNRLAPIICLDAECNTYSLRSRTTIHILIGKSTGLAISEPIYLGSHPLNIGHSDPISPGYILIRHCPILIYAELILNGDPKAYLETVTEYKPLD